MNTDASSFLNPIPLTYQRVISSTCKKIGSSQPSTPEEIHSLRIATKQLRALLKLYYPTNHKNDVKCLNQEIKRLADLFSTPRDYDVFRELITKLCKANNKKSNAIPLNTDQILLTFTPPKTANQQYPISVHLINAFFSIEKNWQRNLTLKRSKDLTKGLVQSFIYMQKTGKKALKTGSDCDYHTFRKWVKHHYYQQYLLFGNPSSKRKKYFRKLKKLEKRLGRLHDYSQLQQRLKTVKDHSQADEIEKQRKQLLKLIKKQKRQCKEKCHSLIKQVLYNAKSHKLS